jgi:GAF domain-containing protein
MENSESGINQPQIKERKSAKYPTIQTRLTIAFTLLGIMAVAAVLFIQFYNFRDALRSEIRQRLTSITRIAALQQDGDLLTKITSGSDEYYQQLNSINLRIKDSDPDLVFVYTMRKNDKGIYFVVDANRPGDEDISAFGEYYQEPGPALSDNFDTMNQTIIEPDFYTDEYGTFLSAYAPIYSSTNANVGVLGIDINASKVVEKERVFLRNGLIILIAIIPVIYLLGAFIGRLLASPLTQLANEARKAGEGDYRMQEIPNPGTSEVADLSSAFHAMTGRIAELVNSLEDKVAERTSQLEQATKRSEYRENLLLAVAEVSSAIASISDLVSLLPRITEVISDRFGHYHVGIFLVDQNKEFATLKAASSTGGRNMLARGHRLRVGEEGIVGYVTGTGKTRLAIDTGAENIHFKNPELPGTRSELALPLIIGKQIIGALDVQSRTPNAFSEDDIKVLSTLANQVAIAIQNANLYSETLNALSEARSAYQKFIEGGWHDYMEKSTQLGFQYSNSLIQPLTGSLDRPEISAVFDSGEAVTDASAGMKLSVPTFAVPVKVRGLTIGVIDVRSINPNRKWEKSDVAAAQTIADRLAFALENARLIDESRQRVARERAISDMSTKIGASVDVNIILQQTVQEIGKLIGNSEVVIQINKDHSRQGEEQ